MISPDSVFGNFVLLVAFMRQLQCTALDEFSAAKAVELDRVTDEVDSQLKLFFTRSAMHDQFAALIDTHEAGAN